MFVEGFRVLLEPGRRFQPPYSLHGPYPVEQDEQEHPDDVDLAATRGTCVADWQRCFSEMFSGRSLSRANLNTFLGGWGVVRRRRERERERGRISSLTLSD